MGKLLGTTNSDNALGISSDIQRLDSSLILQPADNGSGGSSSGSTSGATSSGSGETAAMIPGGLEPITQPKIQTGGGSQIIDDDSSIIKTTGTGPSNLRAVGQNLVDSFNNEVLPFLRNTDQRLLIGGGVALFGLVLLRQQQKRNRSGNQS